MSDDPLKDCPECGKDALRRLIGGGMGVIFKGSGFYVNDSKSTPAAAPAAESAKTPDKKSPAAESKATA
jgi:predicted nucleic acid-binding Zn ribbon protein